MGRNRNKNKNKNQPNIDKEPTEVVEQEEPTFTQEEVDQAVTEVEAKEAKRGAFEDMQAVEVAAEGSDEEDINVVDDGAAGDGEDTDANEGDDSSDEDGEGPVVPEAKAEEVEDLITTETDTKELTDLEKLAKNVRDAMIIETMKQYAAVSGTMTGAAFDRIRKTFFKFLLEVFNSTSTTQGDIDYICYRLKHEDVFSEVRLLSGITDAKILTFTSYVFGVIDGVTPSVEAPFLNSNAGKIRSIG